ncbi:unnamed protein product [Paramecium sonneborni]|uniref:Uncharacterized protein n=1 Tax=Paramecium sonneborni TaxID=65129 RepID=A0A8S1LMU2_9CILI|nr:unnamed protein product [Paramecium sonneborni]
MLFLQQRVLDANMNPNRPQFQWQNNRHKLNQRYEVSSRSNSLSFSSNRGNYVSSFENDLRNSLLAQSHLEYQQKLQQVMHTQNQLLKQQLMEIENRQLKLQNEMLQQQVVKIQKDVENTFKIISKQKLPQINTYNSQTDTQQIQSNRSMVSQIKQNQLNNKKRSISFQLDESQTEKDIDDVQDLQQNGLEDDTIDFEYKNRKKTATQKVLSNSKQKKYYRKIKIAFLAVLAYVRWSKNFRLKRLEQSKKLKIIREKFEKTKQFILSIKEDQIKQALYQWVENIFKEFIYELSKPEFIKHCLTQDYNPNSDDNIIYRQKLILKLTLDFFIRLEKMTQINLLPKLIVNLMYLSLFLSQNSKASLFVAKRTNFYMKNSIKISNQQEKMIIGEYILFRLIIQNMLNIFNNIEYQNKIHEKLTKFFATVIASFIQILYIDYFEDIKLVKEINVQLYQRKIVLDENLKALIILEDKIDENELLILGLQDRDLFETLFQQQLDWISNISKIFHKIILNLHSQI